MAVLFVLMLIGFICYKKRMITEMGGKALSSIVSDIANPAMILYAGMGSGAKLQRSELAFTLVIAFAMFGALILISYLVPVVLRAERKSRGIYHVMTAFSNIGFMGFPIISAIYGPEGLLYASLFTVPYNILIYTYGIREIKNSDAPKEKFRLVKLLNPGVVACILSMVIYLLNVQMPEIVLISTQYLSNLTSPLSMIVIGASIATINLRKLFLDVRLIIFSVIKLIAIPIGAYLIIKQVVSSEMLRGVCLIMLATPVGSMTAVLANQYDGDSETATKGVALTTLLSVATIPLVSALLT